MSFQANEAFYDRIAESYDAIAHSSERESTERGLVMLDAKLGERVFELGFGTGHALVSLARSVGSGGRVDGLDVSGGMKKVTAHRLERENIGDQVSLRVGAAPPLGFGDGTFDATFLSFTLELFPPDEIDQVVRELFRVTKPGGRCVVVAMAKPRTGREDTSLEKVYVWMHRHFPHIVDCHPIEVEATLETGGFKIDRAEHTDIWSLPVAIVRARKA